MPSNNSQNLSNEMLQPKMEIKKEDQFREDFKSEVFRDLPVFSLPKSAYEYVDHAYTRKSIYSEFGGHGQYTFTKIMINGHHQKMGFFTRDLNPYLPIEAGKHGIYVDVSGEERIGEEFHLITRDQKNNPALWNYKGLYRVQDRRELPTNLWLNEYSMVSCLI
jgi:hypothetical protein